MIKSTNEGGWKERGGHAEDTGRVRRGGGREREKLVEEKKSGKEERKKGKEEEAWVHEGGEGCSMIMDKNDIEWRRRDQRGWVSRLLASSTRLANLDGGFNFPVNPIQFELRQTFARFVAPPPPRL